MDRGTVLLFTAAGLGHADPTMQGRLANTFLSLVRDNELYPAKICFYTEGVRLVCSGSPVLAVLKSLETAGVELIVCRTCLDFFGLVDQVQVGVVGGMPDIIEALRQADKVIPL